jgi:prolyl-tRNA editing enzyme YbaK/EbsC (Cys-tRNA(Pro) deacylase)
MTDLAPSAARVAAAARDLGLDVTVVEHEVTARTAEDAALACGCAVGQIVKSLIFRGRRTKEPYLLLVSGANRVDEKAVAASIGEALKRTDADDVRAVTGYAIGGVPPLGHANPIATFLDRDLLAYDTVWAAGGTPFATFAVSPRALVEATGARVIAVA